MNVIDGLEAYEVPATGGVVSIGNFDGVHIGHRLILKTARQLADDLGVPQIVVTFEPHPLAILSPRRAPGRLTTHDERLALLADNRVDTTITIRSTPEFFASTADEFADHLYECCRPRAIIEGPTFNYGRGRTGSVDTLRSHGRRHGYDVRVIQSVRSEDLPGMPEVNSSAVRRALADGRVVGAAAMLGRPHRIVGVVGRGFGRGASLGIPTANLEDIPQMLPANAVYACVAQIDDGGTFAAAANIGSQPTFSQQRPTVEAHLMGYEGDLRGRRIGLYLLEHMRPQQEFGGTGQLIDQLQRDIERVRRSPAVEAFLRDRPTLPL